MNEQQPPASRMGVPADGEEAAVLGRREFMRKALVHPVVVAAETLFVLHVLPNPTVRMARTFVSNISMGHARRQTLHRLFATGGMTQTILGSSNPLQPGVHPDDAWTAPYLLSLFSGAVVPADDIPVDTRRDLICVGSPQSNALSLEHLQYQRTADGSIRRIERPKYDLPMSYDFPPLLGDDGWQQDILRYVGGTRARRPLYRLDLAQVADERAVPEALKAGLAKPRTLPGSMDDKWLSEDWLLVSRVPNIHDPERTVLVFGGMYGTGTKATASLLHTFSLEDLRSIDAQRDGQEYFQSLFHVDVHHDHRAHTSLPGRVRHMVTVPLLIDRQAFLTASS